ncbi:patatin-like phospholipase family protein [Hyunsoonleella ulvae]|uniref:patatin-like phospholipase family protein n=1 Tax=Hyunsoonleella ulvae TaxID=2799948 RepID=UPI00193A11E7|nr:patatin-like phospholipase family protein [Hyunsoonleella ulvae]
MISNFKFSDEEKQTAKTYFDAADAVFDKALKNSDLRLKDKVNKEGEINIKSISDATIVEEYYVAPNTTVSKQRPIVDLVQQGGGMWGIALLGYCYIMEKVGIRFYSHGGTSAGAINALFLASISADIYKSPPILDTKNKRSALKSEILTLIVSNMDFSTFMDRGGIAGKIQKRLFKNFNSKFLPFLLGGASLIILISTYLFFGWLLKHFNMNSADIRYFSFVIGTFNLIAYFFLLYILFAKVLGEYFGINTGNSFLFWVKQNLEKLNIKTTKGLRDTLCETQLMRNVSTQDLNDDLKTLVASNMYQMANEEIAGKPLVVSKSASKQLMVKKKAVEHPKIVLIASNLTHNRIVRFPEQAGKYWENPQDVHPAAYVRASMSLPFIFKTFIPNTSIHFADSENPKNKVNLKARMVDGGMLSNFPIREFHRKSNKAPSFPTFGVLLSKQPEATSANNLKGQKNSLIKYILSYIKTFRNFYDNDYMFSRDEIEKIVEVVDTRREPKPDSKHINWLDFWMSPEDKLLLFERGAEAAIRQLDKFDWVAYKATRIKKLK